MEKDKERLIEELRSADREVMEGDMTREVRLRPCEFDLRLNWHIFSYRLFINWRKKLARSGRLRSMRCVNEIPTEEPLTNYPASSQV